MPEWYFLMGITAVLGLMGFLWSPLLWAWPLLLLLFSIIIIQCGLSARKGDFPSKPKSKKEKLKFWLFTSLLHYVQPVARLSGRIKHGLVPWRKKEYSTLNKAFQLRSTVLLNWSEEWKSSEDWLLQLEAKIIDNNIRIKRGSEYDRWDIQTKLGLFSCIRSLLVIEDHGANKQYLKLKVTPVHSLSYLLLISCLLFLSFSAWNSGAYSVAGIFAALPIAILFRYFKENRVLFCNLRDCFLDLVEQNDEPNPPDSEGIILEERESIIEQIRPDKVKEPEILNYNPPVTLKEWMIQSLRKY
jgi:hypothetical protein